MNYPLLCNICIYAQKKLTAVNNMNSTIKLKRYGDRVHD